MLRKTILILSLAFLCSYVVDGEAPKRFSVRREVGQFVLLGDPVDEQALRDVADALRTHAPRVCQALYCDYRRTVVVELFADQESLDRFGMNPRMRGYPAYSGNDRIQMVSPRNPLPNLSAKYETRVLIAVHEFAHLVNNAVNPDMPLWLNEGAAIFASPHTPYSWICLHQFPFDRIPRLRDLQQAYAKAPGADLFAFTLVDFVVAEFGLDALNQLIRNPDTLERIACCDVAEFERRWRTFMEQHYART